MNSNCGPLAAFMLLVASVMSGSTGCAVVADRAITLHNQGASDYYCVVRVLDDRELKDTVHFDRPLPAGGRIQQDLYAVDLAAQNYEDAVMQVGCSDTDDCSDEDRGKDGLCRTGIRGYGPEIPLVISDCEVADGDGDEIYIDCETYDSECTDVVGDDPNCHD